MKKLFNILGITSGAISLIGGLAVFGKSTPGYVSHLSYGGDAYTGIQNASAEAANNVYYLFYMIQSGLSIFLIAFGIALIAYFGSHIKDSSVVSTPASNVPNNATTDNVEMIPASETTEANQPEQEIILPEI